MSYSAASQIYLSNSGDNGMYILNQKKDLLVQVTDIKLQSTKIIGVSQQHPMGITLAKYQSSERARSVLLSLAVDAKNTTRHTYVFEMPNE